MEGTALYFSVLFNGSTYSAAPMTKYILPRVKRQQEEKDKEKDEENKDKDKDGNGDENENEENEKTEKGNADKEIKTEEQLTVEEKKKPEDIFNLK